ncbi:aminoadipate-semialdehyde dehydrogenase [Moniliophthora roreri]|nr:aminoadipate-semialdehyde dehydrogenase [Moniliophthora roreri]
MLYHEGVTCRWKMQLGRPISRATKICFIANLVHFELPICQVR